MSASDTPETTVYPPRPRSKWLRRGFYALAGLGVLLVLLWAGMLGLMHLWVASPPPLPPEAASFPVTPHQEGGVTRIGASWFAQRDGLNVLYLAGTPYEMGYANGVLTARVIHRQEKSVEDLLDRLVPQRWAQFLVKFVVVWKNRRLDEHVTPELRLEMLGLSRGTPNVHPRLGPMYNRVLNFHGAQDVSYMLMNNPLLNRGCTAFGAWGPSTESGRLLAGRNFDWEADPVFDEDRVVILCEPRNGIPFVSLAWGGMAGCVSGLNREGVSITLNGAPSDLPKGVATPTCLVAREVLQHAGNLAEAIDIVRRRQVFVSAIFLVGSRKDGKFVVIEKTPTRVAVREATENQILCANHYLATELADDPLNQQFMAADTSVARYERLQELLADPGKKLTPQRCVEVLRDRNLTGGRFAGNGHRASLNPAIATHSVVMDLTEGIFWASAPPHQLGRFVAFDLANFSNSPARRDIAEDHALASGEYDRLKQARARIKEGGLALAREDFIQAERLAREAEALNPGFYINSWLLAEALAARGDTNNAAAACRKAWEGKPALAAERNQLDRLALRLGLATETNAVPGSAGQAKPSP